MWALATVVGCTVLLGCFSGTRDRDGADRWLVSATEAGCVDRNSEVVRTVVERNGDRVLHLVVRCERVGA